MGVARPIDITVDQRKTLLSLLKQYLPNTTAWAYGSRVKWTSRPQSDLDLVVFTKPDQERRISELREALEESNLPFRVDLFVWDAVPEQFRKEIEVEHAVLVEKEEQGVAGKWKEERWGDLATLEYGRALRGYDTSQGAFRVFGTNGPIGWHDEALYAHPSVIVGRKGAYRGIHYSAEPFFVIDTAFYLKPKVEMDVRWAYYELLTQDIDLMDSGSAIPSTSREEFYSLPVLVPPLPEQRAIAHVLGTLDDKIELNRRMNETLEAMAHALFKSWFIDFDPVRAKTTLRITPPLRGSRQGKDAVRSRAGGGMNRWEEIQRQYTQQTLQNAQILRENRTDAEGLLWHYLRDKQLDGYKFRRQQPIGPYIVDFACMPQKLLIELDGGQHAEQHTYDQKRDAFLREKGYNILRFWNNEVFENCFGVLENIYAALHHHSRESHHSPLEGESAKQGRQPAGEPVRGDESGEHPPPHQPSPHGSASATPPQGGSDWTVERARAYLDGMDEEIAALFPDRFVESELGEIPKGWEVKTLGALIELAYGKALKADERKNGSIPVYGSNGQVGWHDERLVAGPGIVVGRKGNPGVVTWTHSDFFPIDTTFYVVPTNTNQHLPFLFFALTDQDLPSVSADSAVPGLNRNLAYMNSQLVPDKMVMDEFSNCANAIFARCYRLGEESRVLADLRDKLLPKLVSGEIRTSNVSKGISQ